MRITTRGRYGLRALVHLAMADSDEPYSIRDLAQDEEISPAFLEQLFFRLRKAGIISSTRGSGGGFVLKKDPAQITAKDVFLAVGEEISLTPCTSEDGAVPPCGQADHCIMNGLWHDASDHINLFFKDLTISDIVQRYGSNL